MKRIAGIIIVFLALLFVGACHNSGAEKANAKALASAPANAKAENAVKADLNKCFSSVPVTELVTKPGRAKVSVCSNKILTPAQKQKLETCAVNAAIHDHVITRAGRKKFETVDLGNCITTVVK